MNAKPTFQQRVIKALQQKIPQSKCPLCGVSNWAVQRGTYWFTEHYHEGTMQSIGPNLPCAALVCQNCGNTHFINVSVLDPEFRPDY